MIGELKISILWGNPLMDQHSIQGGVTICLAPSRL